MMLTKLQGESYLLSFLETLRNIEAGHVRAWLKRGEFPAQTAWLFEQLYTFTVKNEDNAYVLNHFDEEVVRILIAWHYFKRLSSTTRLMARLMGSLCGIGRLTSGPGTTYLTGPRTTAPGAVFS